MTRLYDLQEQLVKIDDILEAATDSETQEILFSAREDLINTIDGKLENILGYIADCKARIDQLKSEEERIARKSKSLTNKIDYLKQMLLWYMKSNNKTKDTFGTWDVSVAKTAGKVVLDINEEYLPSWCKKVIYMADKTVLKNQMVDGKAFIEGEDGKPLMIAHIEEGESLRIK